MADESFEESPAPEEQPAAEEAEAEGAADAPPSRPVSRQSSKPEESTIIEPAVPPEVVAATNKDFIGHAGRGDLEQMKMLLDSSPEVDVNFEDEDGWTPLIWAAGLQQVEALTVLDAEGAEIDRLNKDGYSALRFAAANGKASAVRCLLELGADCNHIQNETATPFIAACGKGRFDVMEIMMDFSGPRGGVKMELETPKGKTALHEACTEGQYAAAELLLGRGCKIQAENMWGRTALMEASLYGRCEIIELLVKFHAKVDLVSSKDGATAIGIAHEYKQRNAVGLLESLGAPSDVLQPKIIESFRSRRDKVDVGGIVMQRFGEETFCQMLDEGGEMEIPKLRAPETGHLATVERDYRDKGMLIEEDASMTQQDEAQQSMDADVSWADKTRK